MTRPASSGRQGPRPPGIEIRHSRGCPANLGEECTCAPAFRAVVYSRHDRRKIQRTFPTLSAAKIWRQDAVVDVRRGDLRASEKTTVHDASATWLQQARTGTIRNRSGEIYKPSVLRGYEQALRAYVLPELSGFRLSDLERADVQAVVDRLGKSDLAASTIRNALLPLRAICRRAYARGEIRDNPTRGLELPAVRGRRERIAEPREAAALLAALVREDRPLWATALYAGLRRGELQALRFSDVERRRGVIHVRRSWDRVAGEVAPKSAAGTRTVPIPTALSPLLVAPCGADAQALVFGRTPTRPFEPWSVANRARRAWAAAGLEPITLHECRHTYASLMIAAGVNPKALQAFMGHASITVTLDRYGKLFPGSEDEAAVLLNAYLGRVNA